MRTLKVGEPWGDDPLKYDLSELLEKGDWKWARFRLRNDKTVTLRMPGTLIDSVKEAAKQDGIPYQSLMREMVIEGIGRRKAAFAAAEKLEMSYPKAKKKKKA